MGSLRFGGLIEPALVIPKYARNRFYFTSFVGRFMGMKFSSFQPFRCVFVFGGMRCFAFCMITL